ncbi:MAG: nucleotidyl transferase AbiEii/AbiGii toxin family protein [Flavobacteriales bacterium]|nr:nucleotidyl transferase AbiEii/AbiGii toxin family protein [Flavobacteriales bacterium]
MAWAREEGFYLAGGTALALQIGHRDSIDFDFFKEGGFDADQLFDRLRAATDLPIVKVQEERNTLGVVIDADIKVSFMRYPYSLLKPLLRADHMDLASLADIGCMKLSAITGRGTMKDYVDLYFILQRMPLQELLALCALKLPQLDRGFILKALAYFDDLEPEPILYVPGQAVAFDAVKRFLRALAAKGY